MDINQLIRDKIFYLQKKGIETTFTEVRMLLAFVLNTEVGNLHFYKDTVTENQMNLFDKLIEKRTLHCPVDKILGTKGFYKHDFIVNENVLSPRQDSEVLIEETLKLLTNIKKPKILELGVGSGCLIISLLAEIKDAEALGIDISAEALDTAQNNAKKINVKNRLLLKKLSWFDSDFVANIGGDFDLIISNPPYIPTADINGLDEEVKGYDPNIALDGGEDGLRDYRQIIKTAPNILKSGGFLVLEAGINQAQDIVGIGKRYNLQPINIVKDLNGIERCIILKK